MKLRSFLKSLALCAFVFFFAHIFSSSETNADVETPGLLVAVNQFTQAEILEYFKACRVRDMTTSAQTIHDWIEQKSKLDFMGCDQDQIKIEKMNPKSFLKINDRFITLNYDVQISAKCEDQIEFADYTAVVESSIRPNRFAGVTAICRPIDVK